MATPTVPLPFGIRTRRAANPGRELPCPPTPMVIQTLARADAALAERYVGITTDGQVEPGLFSLSETGVSTRPIKEAAEAYLAALTRVTRNSASFAIDDLAWQRWNNTHPFTMRHGVLLDGLSPKQRHSALALIETSLSGRGFEIARDIMKLNHTIGELTEKWDEYGEWLYWLSIFGTPSLEAPWGWQLDGHHLILNCLVVRDQVVMTPMFMGSEPTHAPTGKYAGTRVFEMEEQAALAFMRSLSDAQRTSAGVKPIEHQHVNEGRIQAGALRDNLQLPYAGLSAAALAPRQQAHLLELIDVYVGPMRTGHDPIAMVASQQQLDRTHVAWSGRVDGDSTLYFPLHTPGLW